MTNVATLLLQSGANANAVDLQSKYSLHFEHKIFEDLVQRYYWYFEQV